MEKQIIISVSREYGSSGHEIAEAIAKDLGLTLYDRALLDKVAEEKGMKPELVAKYDERPRNPLLSRRVGGHSNSIAENIAQMQFEYIKNKAESGESFVIVGRCAETVLRDHPGLISIFILCDREKKILHTREKYNLTEHEAVLKMNRHDIRRKNYHNRHSYFKWGDSRGYDICINSSGLGVGETAKILECYIEKKQKKMQGTN